MVSVPFELMQWVPPEPLFLPLWGQKTSLSVLEGMGFHVGQALGERLPRDTLAFREELDALKFLCKDMWAAVFQKQMDGLRTNHQGTYVLQDNDFPILVRMASGLQYLEEAPKVWGFLAFTCGLLRGTLSTLGIKSLVTASVAALPACALLKLLHIQQQPGLCAHGNNPRRLTSSWSLLLVLGSRCFVSESQPFSGGVHSREGAVGPALSRVAHGPGMEITEARPTLAPGAAFPLV
ncbi:trafficking protein particle complex subunit 6A-like [Trichechus inunguis]